MKGLPLCRLPGIAIIETPPTSRKAGRPINASKTMNLANSLPAICTQVSHRSQLRRQTAAFQNIGIPPHAFDAGIFPRRQTSQPRPTGGVGSASGRIVRNTTVCGIPQDLQGFPTKTGTNPNVGGFTCFVRNITVRYNLGKGNSRLLPEFCFARGLVGRHDRSNDVI